MTKLEVVIISVGLVVVFCMTWAFWSYATTQANNSVRRGENASFTISDVK